jgi:hypothetical protein
MTRGGPREPPLICILLSSGDNMPLIMVQLEVSPGGLLRDIFSTGIYLTIGRDEVVGAID